MFDVVNTEMIGARQRHQDQSAPRVRAGALTRLIDDLLWELEELNLNEVRTVPSPLRRRVAEAVATVTGLPVEGVPARQHTVLAIDLLFEAQATVTARVLGDRPSRLGDDSEEV